MQPRPSASIDLSSTTIIVDAVRGLVAASLEERDETITQLQSAIEHRRCILSPSLRGPADACRILASDISAEKDKTIAWMTLQQVERINQHIDDKGSLLAHFRHRLPTTQSEQESIERLSAGLKKGLRKWQSKVEGEIDGMQRYGRRIYVIDQTIRWEQIFGDWFNEAFALLSATRDDLSPGLYSMSTAQLCVLEIEASVNKHRSAGEWISGVGQQTTGRKQRSYGPTVARSPLVVDRSLTVVSPRNWATRLLALTSASDPPDAIRLEGGLVGWGSLDTDTAQTQNPLATSTTQQTSLGEAFAFQLSPAVNVVTLYTSSLSELASLHSDKVQAVRDYILRF